ncbi:MAG: nuclear transport factor 2 family protein [Candidatus Dormiibacterota bacterium]
MANEACAIAKEFLDRMGAGRVGDALALVEPDAPVELTPLNLHGPAAEVMRRYLADVAAAFPELRLSIRRLFVGMDRTAIAEVRIQGAQAGELWGIPARGRVLELDQVWLLRVDEGLTIDRIGAYWCQYQLCNMLGARRLDRVAVNAPSQERRVRT